MLHDMFELPFEEIAPLVGRSPDAARAELAGTLSALRRLDWRWKVDGRSFGPYARAASALAEREVKSVRRSTFRSEAVERLVIGTVAFERVFGALRRLAHEHHSASL